jgi:hypothetical protein
MTYLTTPSVAQTTCSRTVTWLTNNELERKKSQPTYRYYPKICLKGVRKATETSVRQRPHTDIAIQDLHNMKQEF